LMLQDKYLPASRIELHKNQFAVLCVDSWQGSLNGRWSDLYTA